MKQTIKVWVIYDEDDAYLCPKGFLSEEEAREYIIDYIINDEQQYWFSKYQDYLENFAWKLSNTPKDHAYTTPLSFVDWFKSDESCQKEAMERYTLSVIGVEVDSTNE